MGHSMKLVSRRTGLSPHVIRVWEKRYGAICPQRTPTHRRQFSDEDIQRLVYLKRLTDVGHNIGNVASLPTEDLQELLGEERPAEESDGKSFPADGRFGEREATAYQATDLGSDSWPERLPTGGGFEQGLARYGASRLAREGPRAVA